MKEMTVRVNAKINLTLDVLGRYNVTHHELDMVMASVGIFDIVSCRESDSISVLMDGKPSNEHNTAYKAVSMCVERFGIPLLAVDIHKGIPFSAGLGGSSANCAGVLYCVAKMYGIDYASIEEIAKTIGSDVVYMMTGGIKRAGGKGDDLQALPYHNYSLVVIRPNYGVNTKQVFEEFDKAVSITHFTKQFIEADEESAKEYIGNALQAAASRINPNIERVANDLSKYSNFVAMSGSGSSVYAIMKNMAEANALADKLSGKYFFVKACTTLDYGIKEL